MDAEEEEELADDWLTAFAQDEADEAAAEAAEGGDGGAAGVEDEADEAAAEAAEGGDGGAAGVEANVADADAAEDETEGVPLGDEDDAAAEDQAEAAEEAEPAMAQDMAEAESGEGDWVEDDELLALEAAAISAWLGRCSLSRGGGAENAGRCLPQRPPRPVGAVRGVGPKGAGTFTNAPWRQQPGPVAGRPHFRPRAPFRPHTGAVTAPWQQAQVRSFAARPRVPMALPAAFAQQQQPRGAKGFRARAALGVTPHVRTFGVARGQPMPAAIDAEVPQVVPRKREPPLVGGVEIPAAKRPKAAPPSAVASAASAAVPAAPAAPATSGSKPGGKVKVTADVAAKLKALKEAGIELRAAAVHAVAAASQRDALVLLQALLKRGKAVTDPTEWVVKSLRDRPAATAPAPVAPTAPAQVPAARPVAAAGASSTSAPAKPGLTKAITVPRPLDEAPAAQAPVAKAKAAYRPPTAPRQPPKIRSDLDFERQVVQAKLQTLNKAGIWPGAHPLDESAFAALLKLEPQRALEILEEAEEKGTEGTLNDPSAFARRAVALEEAKSTG